MIVTGKGGVGKSTVSLALAAGARRGKRTIVCEVASQEHLSRVFHRAEVGFHEVEMADNLWAISIDPDEAMREYVLLQLKVKAMRDLLFSLAGLHLPRGATPGLKELVTIGKIWELPLDDRKVKRGRNYDLVIVDAPATGSRNRLPADAAHVRQRRPGRPDPPAGRGPRRVHPRPRRTGSRSSPCPRRCRSTRPRSSSELPAEVGVAVDRIFFNGLYPQRFSRRDRAAAGLASPNGDGTVRAAVPGGGQREPPSRAPSASSSPGSRS